MSRKTKKALMLVGGLVAVLLIAGTVISRAFASGAAVDTAKATRETLSVTVSVSGKTEADRKAEVFAPVPGTLKRVLVTEGQTVKSGQKLAEMDTDSLDAAVDGARSAYEGAVAQLEALDAAVPSGTERNAADAAVSTTRKAYERARTAVDVASAAVKAAPPASRASAEASLANAQAGKDQAYTAYLGAKAQKQRLSTAGDVSERRRAARVSRDAASRSLARAEANRRKGALCAPISGVVVFDALGAPGADGSAPKAVDGSAVAPGAAVFTIVDLSSVKFAGQVDESDVARVKVGSKAVATLDAVPGKDFASTVGSIRPTSVQTANGAVVFPVVMKVANPDGTLRVGMSGNAVISVDDVTNAIAVPIEALVDTKDGQSVFVVEGGKLVKRDVKTGVMTETKVQIVKGLEEGETVAVASGTPLTEGMAVKTGATR